MKRWQKNLNRNDFNDSSLSLTPRIPQPTHTASQLLLKLNDEEQTQDGNRKFVNRKLIKFFFLHFLRDVFDNIEAPSERRRERK